MAKILIIDDDIFITTSMAAWLSGETYEVHVAHSGPQGIKAVRELEPDVVILDLMMPGMSGWEVCREIRKFSQVPILILSAVVDSDLVMQILIEGATDYLVKPVPPGVMISQLKRLTSTKSSK